MKNNQPEERERTAIVPTTQTTTAIPAPTAELIEKSFAENTIRNRRHALQKFDGWLQGRQITDGHLAEYATHLFDIGKAPGTISIVVSAVKWLLKHRNGGKPVEMPITTATLSGIRREGRGRGRGQRNGLTWKEVEKICAVQEADGTLRGLRNSAISACYVRHPTAHFGSDGTSHRRPRGQHPSDPVLKNGSGGSGRTPLPLRGHPPDSC